MNTKLSQLFGIIRYEMRLQWARRSLLIVGICFALITLMFLAMTASSANDLPDLTADATTFGLIFAISPASLLLMLLALPPVVAEAIAKDQQLGMAELRDALPISPSLYLAGKVLGVLACILLMMLTVATLLWIASLFVLGAVDLGAYAQVWLTAIIPAGLFVAALSVLLASRQPNRKRAAMIGGLIAIYAMLTMPIAVSNNYDWLQAIFPAAWLSLVLKASFTFAAASSDLPEAIFQFSTIPDKFIWQTITAAVAQILVVWTAVWGWWQFRRA